MAFEFNPFTGTFDKKVSTSSDIDNVFTSQAYCVYFNDNSHHIKVGVSTPGGDVQVGDITGTGSTKSYSIASADRDFAIQVWFKPTNDGSGGLLTPHCHLVSKLKPDTTWGYAVGMYDSKLWIHIGDADNATDYTAGLVSGITVTPDVWHHALFYFDRSSKCYGFLDGVYTAPPNGDFVISNQTGDLYQTGNSETTGGDAMLYFGRSEDDYERAGKNSDTTANGYNFLDHNASGSDAFINDKQPFRGYMAEVVLWRGPDNNLGISGIDFTPSSGTNATVTNLYNSGKPVNVADNDVYAGTFTSDKSQYDAIMGWWQLNESVSTEHPYDASTRFHYGDTADGSGYKPAYANRFPTTIINSGGPKTEKIGLGQHALELKQNLSLNNACISNDGTGDGITINNDNEVSIPGPLRLGGNDKAVLLRNNVQDGAYLQSDTAGVVKFKGDWEFEETLALSPNFDMYTDIVVSRGGSGKYAGGRIRLAGSGNTNQTMYGSLEFANQQQKDLVDTNINNLKLGARITSVSHGSPNNTDSTPGNLTFGTTPVGSTSPLPRMTITSEGHVGVNMPATSFGPSSDKNQHYLKNIFSPTETFVVFGDPIYSTGTVSHGDASLSTHDNWGAGQSLTNQGQTSTTGSGSGIQCSI